MAGHTELGEYLTYKFSTHTKEDVTKHNLNHKKQVHTEVDLLFIMRNPETPVDTPC